MDCPDDPARYSGTLIQAVKYNLQKHPVKPGIFLSMLPQSKEDITLWCCPEKLGFCPLNFPSCYKMAFINSKLNKSIFKSIEFFLFRRFWLGELNTFVLNRLFFMISGFCPSKKLLFAACTYLLLCNLLFLENQDFFLKMFMNYYPGNCVWYSCINPEWLYGSGGASEASHHLQVRPISVLLLLVDE